METPANPFPTLSNAARAFGPGPVTAPGKWLTASAMLHSADEVAGPEFAVAEEEVRSMLTLFAQLGRSRKDPSVGMDAGTFQSRLSAMPVRSQVTLQQALAGLAAQAPNEPFFRGEDGDRDFALEMSGVPGEQAICLGGKLSDLHGLNCVAEAHLLAHLSNDFGKRAGCIAPVRERVWHGDHSVSNEHVAWQQ